MERIWILIRARLAGEWFSDKGARAPVAPMLLVAAMTALSAGLVRDALDPYPYVIAMLTLALGLTAIPLLGELAPLLREDPAEQWIAAQPVRPIELRAARIGTLLAILYALTLACLVPAAWLAPTEATWLMRFGFVGIGLVQATVMAAFLLGIQVVLGERAEGLLVAVQTMIMLGLIAGLLSALGKLPELAAIEGPTGLVAWVPIAWFALVAHTDPGAFPAALALGSGIIIAATILLAFAPFPPSSTARSTRTPIGLLCAPLAALLEHTWVRREERAVYRFVYDALPAERDFVVRVYPLLITPLAFLLLGAETETLHGRGLLAILLFAPAMYLPVLLMYVPTTATPAARWVVEASPLDPRVEDVATIKAIFVRFLVPFEVVLGVVVASLGAPGMALRLAPAALVYGAVVLRTCYSDMCTARPLSAPAAELGSAFDGGGGGLMIVAILGAVASLAAMQLLPAVGTIVLVALWISIEFTRGRRSAIADGIGEHSTR
jgi:hypothetical protein